MRIALFVTCLVDGLYPAVGQAVVTLLERLGHDVVVPPGQTCCGQMHVNTGYPHRAADIIENHLRAFADADLVVTPSGSCAGAVRHQHPSVLRTTGRHRLIDDAETLGTRTYELSELLVDVLGVTDVGAHFPHRVTYHPTCHSLRLLRVADKPLRLLREVSGIELVELAAAETCCGFGGTFALKNPDTSAAMLTDKMAAISETAADVITAGDASCLMHIGGGLSRIRASAKPLHLAQILASTAENPTSTSATGSGSSR